MPGETGEKLKFEKEKESQNEKNFDWRSKKQGRF